MEQSINTEKFWLDETTQSDIEEMILCGEPFYFQYRDKDYLIEGFGDLGYAIVDPYPYYEDGGWPEKSDFAYPFHLHAKTPEQMMSLPFLDGKTIFERFDELRFYEI